MGVSFETIDNETKQEDFWREKDTFLEDQLGQFESFLIDAIGIPGKNSQGGITVCWEDWAGEYRTSSLGLLGGGGSLRLVVGRLWTAFIVSSVLARTDGALRLGLVVCNLLADMWHACGCSNRKPIRHDSSLSWGRTVGSDHTEEG